MLENIAYIIKELTDRRYENDSIKGKFCNLSRKDIDNISPILEHVEEFLDSGESNVSPDDLDEYLNKDIKIQISTGNIEGYFDTFSSFLIKNKTELPQYDFYIRSIDLLSKKEDECRSEKLKFYCKNIKLINLLKKISDYEKKIGADLELFFYKTEKGLVLKIDYDESDLNNLTITKLNGLEDHFFDKPDKEERKQIFINDLIDLLNDDNTYSNLLKKWDTLQGNYERSFKLYLSGFSFEKIKTSSIGYFQELADRIYHQINKATINIFVFPSAYMFFIKSFGVSGNTVQNILLFITAFIFSLIMHKVVFSNMTDGLDSVSRDIERFKSKADASLSEEIKDELSELKNKKLKRQYSKIKLLKYGNWILFLFACLMFFYTIYPVIMRAFNYINEKL